MGAASVLTVHVRDSSAHSFAALAYSKRRRHHTSAGRLRGMLSGTEVGVAVGYNVGAAGLGGWSSFVRIRI